MRRRGQTSSLIGSASSTTGTGRPVGSLNVRSRSTPIWWYTVRKVMLPNLVPSVFAAWIFAFIGSFDEVIVTSFIAGKYDTVPKKMFTELILEVNPTITAVATLLIVFTMVALAAVALILGRSGRLRPTMV